ncbi:MAG: ABC transporter ATP-binding protein [Caldilineaceae bacterium]|nr:ABC transporter ATP-binding protein [Caldilineaceae bacterium]
MRLGFGGGGMMTGEAAANTRQTLKRMASYLRPYRMHLLVVALFVTFSTILRLYGPVLLGRAIDEFIAPGDTVGLRNLVVQIAIVYIVAAAASTVQGLIMVMLGQRFVSDIRGGLFSHVQEMSMVFHDRNQVGDLMSRITNDSEAINRTLSNGLIEFTSNVLLLGGTFVAMFLLNWQLALAMLVLMPLMLYITGEVTRRSRAAFRTVQRNLGALNAVMEENIAGARVVQAFAREKEVYEDFLEVNTTYRKAGMTADIITAALGPMFTTMMTITIAAAALLGGWLSIQGILEVGVLATFIIYIMNFFRPMRGIAMLYNQLQSALAGAERIFQTLDVEPVVTDRPDAPPLEEIEGDVQFENVSFSYKDEPQAAQGRAPMARGNGQRSSSQIEPASSPPDEPVLQNISLHAKPGATIALVGPTGAGKTTIISLLSRFYDVDEGSIRIDGHDIRDVQQASLRKQLGIVLQDTFLFSGTVRENIRYGRLEATDDEVEAAAKLANADSFIRLLPGGYNSQVSEQGNNFSEGQRQLLAIARAVLADPRILILDEATSSVDTRTEVHLQQALLRLLEGRTAFVIAHRLSTIRNADEVLVVNDHRIIERGSHDELLDLKGFYHDLYTSQYMRVKRKEADLEELRLN